MLEELEVWEEDEDEEEEEEAAAGLRWDRREPSKDCSDRYGAEEVKKKLIRKCFTSQTIHLVLGLKMLPKS